MSYIQSEFSHVAAAPFAMLFVLLVAYILAWLRIRAKYKHQIATLQNTVGETKTDLATERGIVTTFESLLSDVKDQLLAATRSKIDDGIYQGGRPVAQALRVEETDDELLIGHIVATAGFNADVPFLYDGRLFLYDRAETVTERKEENGNLQDFRDAVCHPII